MAKTPYIDLKSEDILSAHVSGLQHSINKIESVLNMKTASASGHDLTPVDDQDDPSLRYRIYEGTIRGWLNNPDPVIYRNGSAVDPGEYSISPGHGVIVFEQQQTSTDKITADFQYITDKSTRMDNVEADIGALDTRVVEAEADIEELKKSSGGGSDNGGSGGSLVPIPLKRSPKTLFFNIRPEKISSDLTKPATNILMAAGKMDAIPIIIDQRVMISRMRMIGGPGAPGGNALMGIYGDNQITPGDLLAQTNVFTHGAGTQNINLIEPVYLDPGLYWLVRWGAEGLRLEGYTYESDVHITFEGISNNLKDDNSGSYSYPVVGVRSPVLTGLTSLPDPFPPVGTGSDDSKYLCRMDIGTIYALK